MMKEKAEFEDEDMITAPMMPDTTIVQEVLTKEYIINIDDDVVEPCNYRKVLQTLRTASGTDTVRMIMNTGGGYLSSAGAITHYLLNTKATTIAEIHTACSAGAMIALNCDSITVANHGFMMLHTLSSGFSGKAVDIKNQSDFINKWNEDIAKLSYQGFLSSAEIIDLLNGTEFWLDKKAIDKRLKTWVPVRKRKTK